MWGDIIVKFLPDVVIYKGATHKIESTCPIYDLEIIIQIKTFFRIQLLGISFHEILQNYEIQQLKMILKISDRYLKDWYITGKSVK